MKRCRFKFGFLILLIEMFLLSSGGYAMSQKPEGGKVSPAEFKIKEALDGDALQLENGELIRLIGVDCPEMDMVDKDYQNVGRENIPLPQYKHYAEEARNFVSAFIEKPGVRVAVDPQHKDVDYRDHLDRTLVYIYAGDEMLNAALIKKGICLSQTEIRFTHLQEFLSYEKEAKSAGRGIWENT